MLSLGGGIVDFKDFAWLSSLWLNHDDEKRRYANAELRVQNRKELLKKIK